MTRMFPFVTHTPNPLGGGPCPYQCKYCWATDLKNRFKYRKYQGPWRIYKKELKNFNPRDFPFAFDMVEIGHPSIPSDLIVELMAWIAYQPCPILVLTKNPAFYRKYQEILPHNMVLGATIECDNPALLLKISKAPNPWRRLEAMKWLSVNQPQNKLFISIEPIMRFTNLFVKKIADIDPWAVAVGYDNYDNGLEEPPLLYTKELITDLQEFTTVYVKTLREANGHSLRTPTSEKHE